MVLKAPFNPNHSMMLDNFLKLTERQGCRKKRAYQLEVPLFRGLKDFSQKLTTALHISINSDYFSFSVLMAQTVVWSH